MLLIVIVAEAVLAVPFFEEGAVFCTLGLLPGEDLLDERLVYGERLVASQCEIGHTGDKRQEATNDPQEGGERRPDELIIDDLVGLGVAEIDETEVQVCLLVGE